AEDGIRDFHVTGVQTCALPISLMDSWAYRSYLSELLSTQGLSADSIGRLPYYRLDAENTERYSYTNETDWQSEVMDHSINQNYRSEERRVGKECTSMRTRYKKK